VEAGARGGDVAQLGDVAPAAALELLGVALQLLCRVHGALVEAKA
jgi:hypothetical protein